MTVKRYGSVSVGIVASTAKPRGVLQTHSLAPASLLGAEHYELLDPQRAGRIDLGRPVGWDVAGAQHHHS
jgi:hypothetical protein